MIPRRENIVFDAHSQRRFDENGFLHVEANPVSKAQVSPYYGMEIDGWEELNLDPERVYYAYRAEESLAEAAPTFNGLPLLLGHYPESAEKPQKEHRVGSLGTDAAFSPPYLRVTLIITDQRGIDAIVSGKAKEISAGYAFDPEFIPGEYEGQKYDFIMKNIRGNHVALVEEGRAGPDVSVQDEKHTQPRGTVMKMKKGVLDWARRTLRMAKDADPSVKQDEVEAAKEILAASKEEQKGEDNKDIGLDEDKDAKINKILTLFPDLAEEKATALADALQELISAHSSGAGDEDPEVSKAKDNAEGNEAEDEDPAAIDAEEVKAALDACGLDADNPEFQKAFAEGVKHGAGTGATESEATDSDTPEEGKKAMDTALRRMGRQLRRTAAVAPARAADAAVAHLRALNEAARKVRPLTGDIVDPLVFDSAEAIYGKALDLAGVDKDRYPRAAWRGMVDVALRQRIGAPVAVAAQDSVGRDGPGKHLSNIRVEG